MINKVNNLLLKAHCKVWDNLITECPLKMMKNVFYFTLKALFVLKIFKFLSWPFGHVEKMAQLKKNFMPPFYGWGSTASRLEPLQGGSLLFTTKFPEISGTHFTNLGRMKGWVDLGATQWFWTQVPWIGNPAPQPLGHCSIFRKIRLISKSMTS